MYILMKPRNTGEKWTKEEKREIKRHLKRISKIFTILIIFLLPGGSLLLPILAEVLDRRKTRRVEIKFLPETHAGDEKGLGFVHTECGRITGKGFPNHSIVSLEGGAMKISSSAFVDGGKIPDRYARAGAGGRNLSIPLSWSDLPPGTKSLALSMVDPHPVAQNWVHWLVINIAANAGSLAEGASRKQMPPGSVELQNSFGDIGYGGPQPPRGSGEHPYVVTLYALSVEKLNLPAATTLSAFQRAMEGKILATAKITGKFER